MNKGATMDARERAELFAETAARKNLAEAIGKRQFCANLQRREPHSQRETFNWFMPALESPASISMLRPG